MFIRIIENNINLKLRNTKYYCKYKTTYIVIQLLYNTNLILFFNITEQFHFWRLKKYFHLIHAHNYTKATRKIRFVFRHFEHLHKNSNYDGTESTIQSTFQSIYTNATEPLNTEISNNNNLRRLQLIFFFILLFYRLVI